MTRSSRTFLHCDVCLVDSMNNQWWHLWRHDEIKVIISKILKSKSLMESHCATQTTVVKYIGAVPVDPNIELEEEKYRLRSPVAAPSSTAAAAAAGGCWHETTTTTSRKEGDGLLGQGAARFLASLCHLTTSLSLWEPLHRRLFPRPPPCLSTHLPWSCSLSSSNFLQYRLNHVSFADNDCCNDVTTASSFHCVCVYIFVYSRNKWILIEFSVVYDNLSFKKFS